MADQFLTLKCRHCDATYHNLPHLVVAWYVIHIVRQHWEYVEELRHTSNERLAEAFNYAAQKGWI